jgi:acyl-CoA synthetase (AMP-forming)/AMP-acid ligase II/acyl carrier protein
MQLPIAALTTNFTEVLEARARLYPQAPALHFLEAPSLTYADLGAQIAEVRERLSAWDIRPGDVVAGFGPTRAQMALACATLPASCVFAPLSAALTREGYAKILQRLQPKAVLVPAGTDHALRAAAQQQNVAQLEIVAAPGATAGVSTIERARDGASLRMPHRSDLEDLAHILVTSGTTGRPKLVPSNHAKTQRYAQVAADWLALSPADVGCHVAPLHLGSGLHNSFLNPLLNGMPLVCLAEADIEGVFKAIDAHGLTVINLGFAAFRELLRRAPEQTARLRRGRLRFLRSGLGRLEIEEIDRLEQAFDAPLLVGFSTSETHPVAHDPLPPKLRKRGAVGLPLGNEVAVLDDHGTLAPHGVGEIVVRGPLVFGGYLDDPALTAASFHGEWFRTGDAGRIDEDGYVHLIGRVKEIINRGGEKVSPVELDAAMESLAGVHEAASFGVPHPTLGEEVVAALVRAPGATVGERQVLEHVRARVGEKRTPRCIVFVEQLPRTDNGKLKRAELAKLPAFAHLTRAPHVNTGTAQAGGPASPLEGALAGLWGAILQVPGIKRDDDFFLLGGDSLRGAQLLAQVKVLFGIEVPLKALFAEASTVAGMARTIEGLRRT